MDSRIIPQSGTVSILVPFGELAQALLSSLTSFVLVSTIATFLVAGVVH